MSEEFLRVARKEVTEDISEIGNLLQHCSSDDDVQKNAREMEKHLHKLKGLAPMMGQEEVGEIASLLDTLFKILLDGKKIEGIHLTAKRSYQFMHDRMHDAESDFDTLKSSIMKSHSQFIQ